MPSLLAMTAGAILAVTTAVNGATLPMEIVANARNATDLPSKLQARDTFCKISYEGGHSYGGGGPGQAVINIYGFGINTYDSSGNFVYASPKLKGYGSTTVSKSDWKGNYDFTVSTSYDFQGDTFTSCKYQYGASFWFGFSFQFQVSRSHDVDYRMSSTSKYKRRKITNSAKEGGGIHPSGFSMELLNPQLRDALPFTSTLLATADSDKAAHGSVLLTTLEYREDMAVQQRSGS
ncbi:hypothetical protein V499_03436 [Pseudogymnoascus sp. VKM F-103]|nr:hypothetical protein V499_03436 [Pseudogymnoascus sp. VKM F-103]